MTVSELINKLKEMDPDAEVHFAYDLYYGCDRRSTQIAAKVCHIVPKIEDTDDGDMTKVIILS